MRYPIRALVAIVLMLLVAAPVLAQGRLIFEDETGDLDRGAIEDAAQPLLDRGAAVALFMVPQGNEADFLDRLQRAGLISDGRARVDMLAVYVALQDADNPNQGYSSIRFGERWNEALQTNNNFEAIRTNELNPNLAQGNFTEGYVSALRAIDNAIANPPRPGGGNVFTFNFWPVVIGVFVLLGLVVGWRVISGQRAAARALADARRRMEEARQAAGGAIADAGRELRNAQEKAEFDRVSYAPADVELLAQMQNEIAGQFVAAQTRFDDIAEELERRERPTIQQYDEAAQGYNQVQQQVSQIRESLKQLSEQRVELDRLARQAPEEIDRAKKKLTEVADRLETLRDDIPDAEAVLTLARQHVTTAEQHQAAHDARSAIAAAQEATAQAQAIGEALERCVAIRDGIVEARNDAEKLAAQGYRMETSHAALDNAQASLTEAAQLLQRQELAQAVSTLQAAQTFLDEAIANGRGLAELRAENERRLAEIETLGQEVAQLIAHGHKTFDIVDEFAESTWDDIRGNGSEAEAAANRAHEHWLSARQNNSMDLQEFVAAKEDLDAAAEELAYARSLVETITQRLKDLEAARDTARDEIAAAAADIARGWEFVHANDPDVGKVPEQKLRQAEELLALAQAEIQKDKPDWLELVKHAQAANNLADEALVGARSEVEAMEKLRTRVQRAQKLAAAEVQKIVQFAGLHGQDIHPDNQEAIARIQQQVQRAYALMQEAEQAEEDRRRAALQQAYEGYTRLQADAATVYKAVYADFQRLEKLRTEVNEELAHARNAILSAERALVNYSSVVPRNASAVQQLKTARRRFDQIKLPISGERNLQDTLNLARSIRRDAQEAEKEIRSYYRPPHDGGAGDLLTGMMIGALLDTATRSGHHGGWGGSGSWSGGSGGGGWGSLGGGGGGWGGGGGGGGGW